MARSFKDIRLNMKTVKFQLGEVEGAKQCMRNLEKFTGRMQQNIYKRAIRPGLKHIGDEAKSLIANIPVNSALEMKDSKAESETNSSMRSDLAKSIKVTVGVKKKRGIYGNVAVRYPLRSGNKIVNKAQLAHLIEYGFTIKTAWYGRKRKSPKKIQGAEFMQSAFKAGKQKAESLIAEALVYTVQNPGVSRSDLKSKLGT